MIVCASRQGGVGLGRPHGRFLLHRAFNMGCTCSPERLVANRHHPGFRLDRMRERFFNAIAIFANDGVMPAFVRALRLRRATLEHERLRFQRGSSRTQDCSFRGHLADPRRTSPPWPPNVFSVGGMVCIAIGAAIAIHVVCGSRMDGDGTRMGYQASESSNVPGMLGQEGRSDECAKLQPHPRRSIRKLR